MERGKKPVPDSTANLLMMLYGVDPKSVKTRPGKLKHLLGAYRLRERIEEWEQSLPIAEVDTALMLNQRVLPKLDVLHQAAANEQRALHLLALLDESITAIVSTLRLGSAIDSELALRVQAGDAVDWEPVLRAGTETKALLLDVDVDADVLYEVSVAESTAAILDPDNHIGTPKEERGMSQVNPDKMKRLVRLQKGG